MASTLQSGTMIVKPLCAKLLKDTQFMGKMDPYCVVKCGDMEPEMASAFELVAVRRQCRSILPLSCRIVAFKFAVLPFQ